MLRTVERALLRSIEFIAVLRAVVSVIKRLVPLIVIAVLILLAVHIFG
jgi:hypothetical protein